MRRAAADGRSRTRPPRRPRAGDGPRRARRTAAGPRARARRGAASAARCRTVRRDWPGRVFCVVSRFHAATSSTVRKSAHGAGSLTTVGLIQPSMPSARSAIIAVSACWRAARRTYSSARSSRPPRTRAATTGSIDDSFARNRSRPTKASHSAVTRPAEDLVDLARPPAARPRGSSRRPRAADSSARSKQACDLRLEVLEEVRARQRQHELRRQRCRAHRLARERGMHPAQRRRRSA